jgi:hypothetical protein
MSLGPALSIAIVVVLCVGLFVMLAWVWARALEVREPKARRRRLGRGQLIALPVLLILGGGRSWSPPGVTDSGLLIGLRVTIALALILALVLFDQDLRRRADDPPTRHRLTAWGVAAIGAVLAAVAATTAATAAATGDLAVAMAVPATLAALAAVGALDLALALAILRRRRERAARTRSDP